MKKFGFNGQMRNEPFFYCHLSFFSGKGAVNAAHICKLRNGVKKRLNFFFFQWPKMDQDEYSPQLSKLMA
jgi:hypothetical protein